MSSKVRMSVSEDQAGNIRIRCGDREVAWLDRESLVLKDLRFRPDGEALIHMQQVCWTLRTNDFYPYLWNSETCMIRTGAVPEEGVRLRIEAVSADGKLANHTELAVNWSEERQCLLYEVTQTLQALEEYVWTGGVRTVNGKEYIVMEYMDPYFKHIVGPATDFDGYWPGIFMSGQESQTSAWRKRWGRMVFQNVAGGYEAHCHNHALGGVTWKIKPGGWIGVFGDEVGNPVYRIRGDAEKIGYAEMCSWGYDLHFWYLTEADSRTEQGLAALLMKPGDRFDASYEIFTSTDELTQDVIRNAVDAELTEDELHALEKPVYVSGVNGFNQGLTLENSQSFFWVPEGNGAVWDREHGYNDSDSLRLENADGEAASSWKVMIGQEMFMEPIVSGRTHVLSAMVRLELAEGGGFQVKLGYGIPLYPGKDGKVHPVEYTASQVYTGSSDWQEVRIMALAPKPVHWAQISFDLLGAGKVWIDNVSFKPIDGGIE